MKLNWVYRPRLKPGHSIEILFNALFPYISDHVELNKIELPGTGNLKWDALAQRKFLKSATKVDLTHVLGDVHYVAPWIKGPQIHTLHDVESLMQGNVISRSLKNWFWLKNMIKHASGISVISEHSNNQLIAKVPASSSLIEIIHNPLILKSPNFPNLVSNKVRFLSVGAKPNKNLLRVSLALASLPFDFEWHIVGRLDLLEKSNLACAYICHDDLDSTALSELYLNSDVLLFPSLFEGFGLPIIEAQDHGVPVITSNITAMPEVGGDSVLYVNPMSVDEIYNAIIRLQEDTSLRNELIKKGLENVKRFQIENIAQQYINWYKKVLSSV